MGAPLDDRGKNPGVETEEDTGGDSVVVPLTVGFSVCLAALAAALGWFIWKRKHHRVANEADGLILVRVVRFSFSVMADVKSVESDLHGIPFNVKLPLQSECLESPAESEERSAWSSCSGKPV